MYILGEASLIIADNSVFWQKATDIAIFFVIKKWAKHHCRCIPIKKCATRVSADCQISTVQWQVQTEWYTHVIKTVRKVWKHRQCTHMCLKTQQSTHTMHDTRRYTSRIPKKTSQLKINQKHGTRMVKKLDHLLQLVNNCQIFHNVG